jgi:hypothetical protein
MTPGVGFGKGVSAALNPANLTQGFGNLLSKPLSLSTYKAGAFGPAGTTIGGETISDLKALAAGDASTGGGPTDGGPASDTNFFRKNKRLFIT